MLLVSCLSLSRSLTRPVSTDDAAGNSVQPTADASEATRPPPSAGHGLGAPGSPEATRRLIESVYGHRRKRRLSDPAGNLLEDIFNTLCRQHACRLGQRGRPPRRVPPAAQGLACLSPRSCLKLASAHVPRSAQLNQVKHAEDTEVPPVGGGDAADANAVVTGGQHGIEQTLAAEPVPGHPLQEHRDRFG